MLKTGRSAGTFAEIGSVTDDGPGRDRTCGHGFGYRFGHRLRCLQVAPANRGGGVLRFAGVADTHR